MVYIQWLIYSLFFIFHGFCHAQNYISNPSFEGPTGVELIPPSWLAGCGVMNTPDTQPGWWNVENKPYDGKSYISLLYKEDGTTESVYQILENPLPAGACFLVEIHLAQPCQDSLSGLFPYDLNHPGDLVIRVSDTYGCSNGQVVALFEQVGHCKWKKYYAVFQSQTEINYIYLEFYKGNSPHLNGAILIDLIVLENIHPIPDQEFTVDYNQTLELNAAINGVGYEWFVNGDFFVSDTSKQIFLVTENFTVDLSYWSADSCFIEQRFVILVKPAIPNIITPLNNDGINDVFFINGLVEDASLSVLNRWGKPVFESNSYKNDWQPSNLSSGVYFYALYLKDTHRFFQGCLTIL